MKGVQVARVEKLECRECGRTYEAAPIYVCDFCFAPLEPVYDYGSIAARMTRESIQAGPASIWRYVDLLPVGNDGVVDLDLCQAGLRIERLDFPVRRARPALAEQQNLHAAAFCSEGAASYCFCTQSR